MKNKVLIVYGGKSVEHDISIITAQQVMKFLPEEYEYLPIYIDRNGVWWSADNLTDIKIYSNFKKLAKNKKQATIVLGENKLLLKKGCKFSKVIDIYAVLNCCHGNIGEDGALQGVFKSCNLPQSSSGVMSSALCMDKVFMKDIFKANDIKSPKYVSVDKCTYEKSSSKSVKEVLEKLKLPVVVKPANLGSSIGISVCKDEKSLAEGLNLAFEFDRKVLVEEMVENLREFNCACFNYKEQHFLSHVNEVKNKKEIYSFEDKYLAKESKNQATKKSLSKKIQNLTEKVYKLFDCQGVVRIDFLFDDKQEILYVNEINSIPGSLAFYLFKDIPFKDLLGSIIEQSVCVSNDEKLLTKTFESDALKIFSSVSNVLKK